MIQPAILNALIYSTDSERRILLEQTLSSILIPLSWVVHSDLQERDLRIYQYCAGVDTVLEAMQYIEGVEISMGEWMNPFLWIKEKSISSVFC